MENWSRKRLKRGGEELLSIASSSPSSLLHDFLPRTDVVGSSPSSSPSSSSSRLWLCFWLARAGCNRFPEARAHYRPVGLAITCEASFDFVCASQHSFRLSSTRPSEILRGPFQRKGKRLKRERERREGRAGISRETAVCCCCCCCFRNRANGYDNPLRRCGWSDRN